MKVFVDILCMTRSCAKFPAWNKETVDKAFQWADHVKVYGASTDDVQKKAILIGIGETHVDFLDKEPLLILESPVETLTRAIMSSPILTWLHLYQQVVNQTLSNASIRIGHEVTVDLVTRILEATWMVRMKSSAKTRLTALDNSESTPSMVTAPTAIRIPHEQNIMALELLVRICIQRHEKRIQRDCEDTTTTSSLPTTDSSIQILKKAAASDIVSLRLLCVALTMTPATVACGMSIYMETNEPFLNEWELVYSETHNQELWEIIHSTLQQTPALFFYLDANFSLVTAMCLKDAKIDRFFYHVLCSEYAIKDKTEEKVAQLRGGIHAYILGNSMCASDNNDSLSNMISSELLRTA